MTDLRQVEKIIEQGDSPLTLVLYFTENLQNLLIQNIGERLITRI